MLVLLKCHLLGGGGPQALCLVAWILGIAAASSTSPSLAASGVPPLVSAVVVDGLSVGTQSPAIGIGRSLVVRWAPLGRFRSSVWSALCFVPVDSSPKAQTPDRWLSAFRAPVPSALRMQQLGNRSGWLWKIAPKASYLWCVLFCFVFSICFCPRTPASAAAPLPGEMAWPSARVLRQVVGLWRRLHAMGR